VCVCVNDRTETIISSRRAKMATTDYVTYIYIYIYIIYWNTSFFSPQNIDDESTLRGVCRRRRNRNENNNIKYAAAVALVYGALAHELTHTVDRTQPLLKTFVWTYAIDRSSNVPFTIYYICTHARNKWVIFLYTHYYDAAGLQSVAGWERAVFDQHAVVRCCWGGVRVRLSRGVKGRVNGGGGSHAYPANRLKRSRR